MMRKHSILAMLVLAVFGMAACDEESTGPEDEADELVGTWVSAGDDVALGLQAEPFNIDSIVATFNENNSYTVLSYVGDAAGTINGTYTIGSEPEGQIRSIVLTASDGVESTGIFEVDNGTMTYEVIQTQPALQGVNPPTVEGGFGSTTVGGTPTAVYWVQEYVRRD